MAAGQGLISNPLNVSFQVSLVPTDSQVNGKAGIIGAATISGDDGWTDATLQSTADAVDTSTLADVGMTQDKGVVQPRN